MVLPQRLLLLLLTTAVAVRVQAFTHQSPTPSHRQLLSTTLLQAVRQYERSKRQERVGNLVRTELSGIIHRGHVISRDNNYASLDAALRQRISIVRADVSPDLRQARISVSIGASPKRKNHRGSDDEEEGIASTTAAVDKRRAYSWLVRNTKAIRHALAQRMSHIKTCPSLTFVQVDVSAAVDVMYLIDKVSEGYKRESIDGARGSRPTGVVDGIDFDEEFNEDEWDEEDDDFF